MTDHGEQKHLCVFVEIQVAPENAKVFLDGLRISYDGVASEKECIFYDLFEEVEQPGLFHIVEVWTKDKEWFEKVSPFLFICA